MESLFTITSRETEGWRTAWASQWGGAGRGEGERSKWGWARFKVGPILEWEGYSGGANMERGLLRGGGYRHMQSLTTAENDVKFGMRSLVRVMNAPLLPIWSLCNRHHNHLPTIPNLFSIPPPVQEGCVLTSS